MLIILWIQIFFERVEAEGSRADGLHPGMIPDIL